MYKKGLNMTGTVKMFNKDKGYGFIITESNEEVFFHYSALVMDGYKTIAAGERVEFDLEHTDRGNRAQNVKKL
ncbi:MAG: cold-shock protein [Bacilli bacterium]|jgi:CspA family cold shock protein